MSETNKIYRNAGLFSFGDGFNIKNNAPIDSRAYVNNITDIYDDANWIKADVKPYPGLIVSAPSGDVKIYVGPVIEKLESVIDLPSNQKVGWRNEEYWLDVTIPIDPSDAGRLLTVVEINTGTAEDPVYKYKAQWVDAPSGLPVMSPTEAGKLLTVVQIQTGIDEETEEPIYEYVAQWADAPSGLPDVADTDKGKALFVDETSGEVVWETINTSLMTEIETTPLISLASTGQLKPGMKYRITDYAPVVNSEYRITDTINNRERYKVGAFELANINFDIIVTASSERTLFDDVELITKSGLPSTFQLDYSKYKAKYDLFGNKGGDNTKYQYLDSNAAGVIYYMKDQFGNEASYDFENVYYIDIRNSNIYYAFTGASNTDLRIAENVKNVRIKHSSNELPGVIFKITGGNAPAVTLNDVEIDNCNLVHVYESNLHHVKISDSSNVSINIGINYESQVYRPTLENLNICENISGLTLICQEDVIAEYENYGGIRINNLNVLPSWYMRSIPISDLLDETKNILVQGLKDSDLVNEANLTTNNALWIFNIMSDENTEDAQNAYHMLGGNDGFSTLTYSYDKHVFDSILKASKIIKPFDIFNPKDENGYTRYYTLEIPQFQSTATSVVELGI
jgi:hypothetical protein